MCVMHARAAPYCSFQSGLRWAGEGVINPSLSASTLQRALLLTHNYVRFHARPSVVSAAISREANDWGGRDTFSLVKISRRIAR